MGCLNDLLMYVVVAPAIGVFVAVAFASGDPLLIVGAIAVGVPAFCLYLLATWGD